MSKKKTMAVFGAGLLIGAIGLAPVSQAAEEYIQAMRSAHSITVDGRSVTAEAYLINGSNYFRLRDIAELVDFGVTWNGDTRTVEIDTAAGYTPEQPAATPSPQHSQTNTDYYSARVEVVERANELRRTSGQASLAMDADLMAAAQVRAEEVAATKAYRHTRPDGSDNDTVLTHTGTLLLGENLGMKDGNGTTTLGKLPQVQVESWINSEAHHRNMLNSIYHSMGVGIAKDGYGMYYIALLLAGGEYTVLAVDGPRIP